ncbi:hypothetical protein LshimejAT787_1104140 [Lyophyllum shimeji]|uniref:Uncharacterized protein n=1 Tax=Lyophyllum shimeji TaxID=47721 RepID=A0A9P3UP64_LYOSH|nr:hypothetical protein LshimejAT787_1104140 [Lyophyllum shimeji]
MPSLNFGIISKDTVRIYQKWLESIAQEDIDNPDFEHFEKTTPRRGESTLTYIQS